MIRIFPGKSGSVSFLSLSMPNILPKSWKSLWWKFDSFGYGSHFQILALLMAYFRIQELSKCLTDFELHDLHDLDCVLHCACQNFGTVRIYMFKHVTMRIGLFGVIEKNFHFPKKRPKKMQDLGCKHPVIGKILKIFNFQGLKC